MTTEFNNDGAPFDEIDLLCEIAEGRVNAGDLNEEELGRLIDAAGMDAVLDAMEARQAATVAEPDSAPTAMTQSERSPVTRSFGDQPSVLARIGPMRRALSIAAAVVLVAGLSYVATITGPNAGLLSRSGAHSTDWADTLSGPSGLLTMGQIKSTDSWTLLLEPEGVRGVTPVEPSAFDDGPVGLAVFPFAIRDGDELRPWAALVFVGPPGLDMEQLRRAGPAELATAGLHTALLVRSDGLRAVVRLDDAGAAAVLAIDEDGDGTSDDVRGTEAVESFDGSIFDAAGLGRGAALRATSAAERVMIIAKPGPVGGD